MIIRGYVAIFNFDPENKQKIEEIVKVVGATDKYQLLRSSMNHEDLFIIMSIKNKLSIILDFELSGNDHEISIEKIYYKFSEWDEKYGIRILGISYDWIEFQFKVTTNNIDDIANEIVELCPDTLEQGYGSKGAIKEILLKGDRIFLWWD
jgi:hypothetical protein